jgi:hypothetical protein
MKMKDKSCLIIMAKQPRAGMTKTLLCPPFTYEDAALFFESLLKDTISMVNDLKTLQLAIAVSPPESLDYFRSITPPGTLLLPVEGKDIGVCLQLALGALLDHGFMKVATLNADGPSLPLDYILQGFELLDTHDLVLGEGEDGGYYMLGCIGEVPPVFDCIPWSCNEVLKKNLSLAHQQGLRVGLTPPWYDVDMPEDVSRLYKELTTLPGERLRHTRRFFEPFPIGRLTL